MMVQVNVDERVADAQEKRVLAKLMQDRLPNEAQVALLKAYFEGQFAHWLTEEDETTPQKALAIEAAIRDSGEADTLLLFLWRELSDELEPGDLDLEEAARRCNSAIDDLERVRTGLIDALYQQQVGKT